MRRFALVAIVGTSVAWAMATIGGCSSDAPATPTKDAGKTFNTNPTDQSSTSSSASSSSSSSSSGGGGAGDGGGTKDAAPVTTLASNPKKVSCLAKECDTGTDTAPLCCWPDNDEKKATCEKECLAPVGLEFGCDENADCAADNTCCLTFGGSACTGNDDGCQQGPHICKSDTECATGEKCNAVDCKRGGGITLKIKACTNGLAIPDGCEGG